VTLKLASPSLDAHVAAWRAILPGLLVISQPFGEQRSCTEYKASHPSRLSGALRNVSLLPYVMDVTRRWKQTEIT